MGKDDAYEGHGKVKIRVNLIQYHIDSIIGTGIRGIYCNNVWAVNSHL